MRRVTWAVCLAGAAAVVVGCATPQAATQAADGPAARADSVDHSGGWIGKTAAGFALPGVDGNAVDVSKVLGAKPAVLIFYRGVW